MRRIKCSGFVKWDNTVLAENPEVRAHYEAIVEKKLVAGGVEPVVGAEELYQRLKKAVKEAADEVLSAMPRHKNGAFKYLTDQY